MDLKTCERIVHEVVEKRRPISHQCRSQLQVGDKKFRVQPDEQFLFKRGQLLVEYERTRRPVESVSKYWWLLYATDWRKTKQRVALVVLLLDDSVNEIRVETIELLGEKLHRTLPRTFGFWSVRPSKIGRSVIQRTLGRAIAWLSAAS